MGLVAINFQEWWSHERKSLANRITIDPKIVIHGKKCISLFLTRYFMSWRHNSAKNYYRSLIWPLSLKTAFSGLALWPQNTWFVTSHERGLLILWRHIRRLFLWAHWAQSRSSHVNNSSIYRFLTSRYSRLSVYENVYLIDRNSGIRLPLW